jgi:hypothetical protein
MSDELRPSAAHRKGDAKAYERLLSAFNAAAKPNGECVAYLVSLGFTQGQARNAVYRYRTRVKAPTAGQS